MRILFVSHLLSPGTCADSDNPLIGNTNALATFEAATAMSEAGHEVAIYLRSRCEGKEEETDAQSDRFTNLYSDFYVRESYVGKRQPSPTLKVRRGQEDRFRAFLTQWKPDIVHFYHLLYHSFAYPSIARAAGAATVLTLTDFYFSCPKRDRILYNGESCTRTPERTCVPCFWRGKKAGLLPPAVVDSLIHIPYISNVFDLSAMSDDLTDWLEESASALDSIDRILTDSPRYVDDLRAQGIATDKFADSHRDSSDLAPPLDAVGRAYERQRAKMRHIEALYTQILTSLEPEIRPSPEPPVSPDLGERTDGT